MADVVGNQTSEEVAERQVVLRGTSQMVEGDENLLVTIPVDSQAPTGRFLDMTWTVIIMELEAVPEGNIAFTSGFSSGFR